MTISFANAAAGSADGFACVAVGFGFSEAVVLPSSPSPPPHAVSVVRDSADRRDRVSVARFMGGSVFWWIGLQLAACD